MKFLKVNLSHPHIYNHFCSKYDISKLSPEDGMVAFFNEFYWPSGTLERSLEELYGWSCITIPFTYDANNSSYKNFMQKIVMPFYGIDFNFERPYFSILNIISYFKPNILYLHEAYNYSTDFVAEAKRRADSLEKVLGWCGVEPTKERCLKMSSFDHIFTCVPDINKKMLERGVNSINLGLSFDSRVLEKISTNNKKHGVIFTGSVGSNKPERLRVLQRIESSNVDFKFFCPNDNMQTYFKNPFLDSVWGLDMYQLLADSKIVLNIHDETVYAGNLRLYEATGVGSCLLTDNLLGLNEIFDIDKEVVGFRNVDEAIEKIKYYLENDEERENIAKAGQKRTLDNYTYEHRAKVIYETLCG